MICPRCNLAGEHVLPEHCQEAAKILVATLRPLLLLAEPYGSCWEIDTYRHDLSVDSEGVHLKLMTLLGLP